MFPIPARPTTRNPGRWRGRWPTYHHSVQPQASYTQTVTTPLSRSTQGLINGAGVATVAIGPAGVGNRWYPLTATFSTTTGPSDGSVAHLYAGFVSEQTLLNGQGYHGGGDSAGLAVPVMTPGDLIVAQWTGGNPGDIAQLTVIGTQDALVIA
jgi:hypothetical protein